MKVLVTGAAGFLGSHLVDRLIADGHDVHGLDDLSSGRLANLAEARRSKQFVFSRFDVRDALLGELLAHERPEVVCHLAASAADPLVAVVGTVNLVAAADGVRKLVVAGSGAVYGRPSATPVGERAKLAPVTAAGAAAAAAELFLAASGRSGGPEWTVLALGEVYGPRAGSGAVADALRGVAPAVAVDLVYVDDAVDAFSRALGDGGKCRRLNVGTGTTVAPAELARMVGLTEAVSGAGPGVALENGGIRRALGWEPFTAVEGGLRATRVWVRDSTA
ncbi:MAG: UDP-glucose 4-epimerase [Actinomycetota bacterium]|nr:UDP-glucose 4-epimerase [Actinomycetota bacterium]